VPKEIGQPLPNAPVVISKYVNTISGPVEPILRATGSLRNGNERDARQRKS
jgi:hypothetical protein